MSKLWRIVVAVVVVIVVLVFVYKAAFRTPEPVIEPDRPEQSQKVEQKVEQPVADGNLSVEERLAKRKEARMKRAEELRDARSAESPVKIEDTKPTGSGRLYRRILLENKIATARTADYKRMVDYSRKLLTEYPNTPQATEIKKLLAQLPPQEKKKYSITKEEMGP